MIFYFTGTGNSLYCAKAVGDKEHLISIGEAIKQKVYSYELKEDENIGFVMPTYFWGIPTIVKDFINNLKLIGYKNQYLYLILTCGSSTADTGGMFQGILKKQGYELSAQYSIAMVDNYIPMFKIVSAEKQKKVLKDADKRIAEIKENIKVHRIGDQNLLKGKMPKIGTALVYPIYSRGRSTKRFHVTNHCVGCGKCVKMCPIEAIKMKNNKPEWVINKCVLCLGCINRCPKEAIEYGRSTKNKGRFVNKSSGIQGR